MSSFPLPHITPEPSATVTINSLAAEKKAHGELVYNLAAGEPVLSPHRGVVEQVEDALKKGYTLYPPVQGIGRLIELARNWMNEQYGSDFSTFETLVTPGGKFGIFLLLQAYLQPGNEVIIPAPYWVSYTGMVRLFGGKTTILATRPEQDWKFTPHELEQVCTEKSKILLLNNGANPTGVLYSKEELEAILTVAQRKNLIVISDEVYSELVYDRARPYVSCASFPEYRDHLFVIQSCSKHFAMTGWRVGFVFGNEKILKILTMLVSQSTSGTGTIDQYAAIGAFEHAAEIQQGVRSAMQQRRDLFVRGLEKILEQTLPMPPAALYSFVPISLFGYRDNSSAAFCEELLRETNIAAVPGIAFGQEGYVRFAFGENEEVLRGALQALEKRRMNLCG